jgi:hypothetical protein
MNDVIAAVLRLLLRLVWLMVGLVVLISFLFAALVAATVLGVRYLWARLMGKPVSPFVPFAFSSFSQRSQAKWTLWGQFKSATDGWTSQATGQPQPTSKLKTHAVADDVTDVESRPARSSDSPSSSN